MAYMNACLLVGLPARAPEAKTAAADTPLTTAHVCLVEEHDGQTYRTYVPIEAWGKSAQILSAMHEGDVVLIRGKLQWHSGEKEGQRWRTLVVRPRTLQPLAPAEVPSTSHS